MVKLQQKISRGMNAMKYFVTTKWTFKNENYLKLQVEMSENDRKIFYMDTKLVRKLIFNFFLIYSGFIY